MPTRHTRSSGEPLVAVAVVASAGLVLALSVRRRDVVTPLVSAAGAVLVLAGRYTLARPLVTAAGAVLLVAAAVVNARRCRSHLARRQRRAPGVPAEADLPAERLDPARLS